MNAVRRTFVGFGVTLLSWGAMVTASACFPIHEAYTEGLEYEVKAAYLLNFARYVEWAPSSNASRATTLTLCVVGTNPFEHLIDTLRAKQVRNLNVAVRTIKSLKLIPSECQIVFVPESELDALSDPIRSADEGSFLLVTERSLVGAINFVMVDRKVRFDVNLDVATNFGVHLGSQLLKLAVEVKREERE